MHCASQTIQCFVFPVHSSQSVSYTHLDVYKRQEYAAPCGVCRQVMMEFCDPKTFKIILAVSKDKYDVFTLNELLPLGFGSDNLA